MTFTNVVFPEYCKPTSVNSISSFQNKLLNQSKMRLIKANISVTLFSIEVYKNRTQKFHYTRSNWWPNESKNLIHPKKTNTTSTIEYSYDKPTRSPLKPTQILFHVGKKFIHMALILFIKS
jgi:hypothetical protein